MAWIPKYPENIPGGDSVAVLSRHTTRHDRGETQPVRLSRDVKVRILCDQCSQNGSESENKIKLFVARIRAAETRQHTQKH